MSAPAVQIKAINTAVNTLADEEILRLGLRFLDVLSSEKSCLAINTNNGA